MPTQDNKFFSDFNMSFATHDTTKDLSVLTNENSVKQAIKNLILTDVYERPFQPGIGCNIRNVLFELFSPQTSDRAKTYIRETIEQYEPRASIKDISVSPNVDRNSLAATIKFSIINTVEIQNLTVLVDRIR